MYVGPLTVHVSGSDMISEIFQKIPADFIQGMMEDKVPIIMQNVFECTLDMINKDFHEYPEHRVQFFKLLQAINYHCFPALLRLDQRQFKFVIDSCMWASKHDNREVENTGLTMCVELINNMSEADAHTASIFFQQFYIPILQDVFFVLTDTDHKGGKFPGPAYESCRN
jgi:exportin-1